MEISSWNLLWRKNVCRVLLKLPALCRPAKLDLFYFYTLTCLSRCILHFFILISETLRILWHICHDVGSFVSFLSDTQDAVSFPVYLSPKCSDPLCLRTYFADSTELDNSYYV